MPFVRISVPGDTSREEKAKISRAVHAALVKTCSVPEADLFQVITSHDPDDLIITPEFLGIEHSAKALIVQINLAQGRTRDIKKALYSEIASGIAASTAFKASDVIISLVEVQREDWSFGNGIAQYVA